MSPADRAAAVSGDQFYVTHCTTADSIFNSPGYSVRAASTSDPNDLHYALEYPPYELPIEMWKAPPPPADAPRRLARTPHPRGGVWVAHSAFLERDTMGRDRSYFTHLFRLPASVGPAAVLESWAAEGCAKDYPAGATKTLVRAALPVGGMISVIPDAGDPPGEKADPGVGGPACPGKRSSGCRIGCWGVIHGQRTSSSL